MLSESENTLLPSEVILDEVVPNMSRRTLLSLASTCHFFARDPKLRDEIIKKTPKIASDLTVHVIKERSPIYVLGNNASSQLGLGHDENEPCFSLTSVMGFKF